MRRAARDAARCASTRTCSRFLGAGVLLSFISFTHDTRGFYTSHFPLGAVRHGARRSTSAAMSWADKTCRMNDSPTGEPSH